MPSPGREAGRELEPEASCRRTPAPERYLGSQLKFHRGERAAANVRPGTSAPARESALPVSGSNQRGSNGPRSSGGGIRTQSSTAGGRPAAQPRRRERAAGVALAGPGPSRASPRARRKVSSQSPPHPLAQPTAQRNRRAARGSRPRGARPRCRDPRPRLPQPTPPPRSTYRRAGRRAAAGRAAAATAAASGAAAGARPRGEKRGKVVLCRLRDTAEPAPGSAPFPTLPPARRPARRLRFPGTRRLRLWAAAAAAAAEGRTRAFLTPSS